MTHLEFHRADVCFVCRCRLRGFMLGSFRVNKGSLRSTSTCLIWAEPDCFECLEPAPTDLRWRLTADALASVIRIRVEKGWAAA